MPASRKIQICHISLLKRNEANYRCHLQHKSHWLTGDMSPKPLILDANISQCTFSWKTFRDSLSYHFLGQLVTNNPSAASTMTGCNPHNHTVTAISKQINISQRHLLMVSDVAKGAAKSQQTHALCACSNGNTSMRHSFKTLQFRGLILPTIFHVLNFVQQRHREFNAGIFTTLVSLKLQ